MTRHTPRRYRFGTILALAGAALFATAGVAAADTESGQIGHYNFKDNQSKPNATCIYSGSSHYSLNQIVVKAPSVWWPDTNSSNNREHGRVGWQISVQISLPGAYGPWKTLYMTEVDKKRAYEDQPPYDKADKAPLAQWTLNIPASNYNGKPNAYARVVPMLFWYAGDGSTMGSVTHDQTNYKWQNTTGITSSTTACPIHFTPT
jgi:hypothetical protein